MSHTVTRRRLLVLQWGQGHWALFENQRSDPGSSCGSVSIHLSSGWDISECLLFTEALARFLLCSLCVYCPHLITNILPWIIKCLGSFHICVISSDAISVRQVTKLRHIGQVWGDKEQWGLCEPGSFCPEQSYSASELMHSVARSSDIFQEKLELLVFKSHFKHCKEILRKF